MLYWVMGQFTVATNPTFLTHWPQTSCFAILLAYTVLHSVLLCDTLDLCILQLLLLAGLSTNSAV